MESPFKIQIHQIRIFMMKNSNRLTMIQLKNKLNEKKSPSFINLLVVNICDAVLQDIYEFFVGHKRGILPPGDNM